MYYNKIYNIVYLDAFTMFLTTTRGRFVVFTPHHLLTFFSCVKALVNSNSILVWGFLMSKLQLDLLIIISRHPFYVNIFLYVFHFFLNFQILGFRALGHRGEAPDVYFWKEITCETN